jgi:hypothetical protein
MKHYLLIDNGHGLTVCDISEMKLPSKLSSSKITEKELEKILDQNGKEVWRIFARIEKKKSKIEAWGMFNRTLDETKKKFIKDVLDQDNSFKNEKRKKKITLIFQFH